MQDVRRSDPSQATARAEPEPEAKAPGFARGLFRFGGKRKKGAPEGEPGLLQNRLKEVLERDRALIASQPPAPLVETDEAAQIEEDEEVWPDPFGRTDPDLRTGTRATVREPNPFPDDPTPTEPRRLLELASPRESADLTFSQIASWIEEEISELPEPSSGPVSLDAPLDEDEAAELDAVLAGHHEEPEPQVEPVVAAEPEVAQASDDATPAPAPEPEVAPAKAKPAASARPVPRPKPAPARPAPEPDADAPTREPIRTLTMARLLAMQGYKSRALVVYRELMERAPEDEALRAEFEKLSAS